MFPASNQAFLEKRGSDHRPVLLSLMASQESYRGQFKFDCRFLHQPNIRHSVSQAWNASPLLSDAPVSHRIRLCRKALSKLKKVNNLNSKNRILELQSKLEIEHSSAYPNFNRLHILKFDLMKAYKDEKSYWSKKCKEKWAKSGDKNTKFFHASVKANRSKMFIEKLSDQMGREQRNECSKGVIAVDYFSSLFSSTNPLDFHHIFHDFQPRVKDAVFSINPSKAPGADGMSSLFFQQFWDIVGEQVTAEICNFFRTGVLPSEWNYTQLCLIPKKVNSSLMSDLRPISLCSVLYKVIAKILSQRLKPILPLIVSPTQSAFVSERLIYDNIFMAHEVLHSLSTQPTLSSQFMAIKSDMSKAFDRVEWKFLKELLQALGFHQ